MCEFQRHCSQVHTASHGCVKPVTIVHNLRGEDTDSWLQLLHITHSIALSQPCMSLVQGEMFNTEIFLLGRPKIKILTTSIFGAIGDLSQAHKILFNNVDSVQCIRVWDGCCE